jgi:hypothetical protein
VLDREAHWQHRRELSVAGSPRPPSRC